eukprot:1941452-Pleurochrysis_carterae.AAC.1
MSKQGMCTPEHHSRIVGASKEECPLSERRDAMIRCDCLPESASPVGISSSIYIEIGGTHAVSVSSDSAGSTRQVSSSINSAPNGVKRKSSRPSGRSSSD